MSTNMLLQKIGRACPFSALSKRKKMNNSHCKIATEKDVFVAKSLDTGKVKYEAGDFVDNMGVLIVMVFIFALLYSFFSYAKIVQMKLDIDHIAKKYLYQMEQYGYLPSDIGTDTEATIAKELEIVGCNKDTFELDKTATQYGEANQVEYGNTVSLSFYVQAQNPFYKYLYGSPDDNWFFQNWIDPHIDINVYVESTSKW